MDHTKLQEIVDKMAINKTTNGWVLDKQYATEFFKIITPYVRKAAYRSDRYDPEDAAAQVQFELWRALEKYGPRPLGNTFSYTLKLKTNNVLTNRNKKRESWKSKLNFISSSYETLLDDYQQGVYFGQVPSVDFVDPFCIDNFSKNHKRRSRGKVTMHTIVKKIDKLDKPEQETVLYDLMSKLTGISVDIIQSVYRSIFINLIDKNNLYIDLINDRIENSRKQEEVNMSLDLEKVSAGDKFVSKFGKVFEIRKCTEKGYRICVLCTGQELEIDAEYLKNSAKPYGNVPVAEPTEYATAASDSVNVEQVDSREAEGNGEHGQEMQVGEKGEEQCAEECESNEIQNEEAIEAKGDMMTSVELVQAPEAKEDTASETSTSQRVTQKSFIVDLLKSMAYTRRDLALALMNTDMGKYHSVSSEEEIKKVTSYVSVIIAMLKKEGVNVVTVDRGKYQIT